MIYHVHTHAESGWVVRREGSSRAVRRFRNKRRALWYAQGVKGWTEIVIHRWDGTVSGVQHRKPKPVVVAPLPKLKRETLAGRMVRRFARARA